ncbi:MAG: GntR family transcriptional regulator [Candidatus Accumulibacter sp.]|jgi:DNA-binding FadR family transcriptional regulator|nr:GntR family transcriptional regulator [Accumulibacter sp.]
MEKQEQIERKLEQMICRGRWRLMDRLPSERELAEEFSVSRNTLRVAIRALCGRGILETKRSSGTIVRMMPSARPGATSLFASLRLKTEAFGLLMPAIVLQCAYRIAPGAPLALEPLLPQAGAALRSRDVREFAQIQSKFFIELARLLGNAYVTQIAAGLLPEGRDLVKLLEFGRLSENEMLFSTLVKLSGALRRAEPEAAAKCASDYAAALAQLLDKAAKRDAAPR